MELRDYLRVLRKRRLPFFLALLGCLAAAAVLTMLATPQYEARAKLFVGQRQIAATEISQGFQVTQLSQQLLKSYATVIRTRPIAERAVEQENLSVTPSALASAIRADPIIDTQIIELSYTSADPTLSQRVVNAMAEAFVAEVERIELPRNQTAEPAVRVALVEPALRPESPVSPRPLRNMLLALGLGLLSGTGLVLLLEYFDTTVKSQEEVEGLTGVPVLAMIPRIDTHDAEVYLERDPQSAGAEAFRKLRTAVQFLGVDHPLQTVLVTSAFAREGKTTTSLNLAASFAQAGLRTVLVEADLRRPMLHKLFSSDGQKGLTTCLIGRVPLEQAVLPTPIRNLRHVPAGAIPPNAAELLASEHMADVLVRLRTMADVIVVDAPPLLPVADASALAPRADGVLLVARAGATNRDRLKEASNLLFSVGGRLLGVVLNYLRPDDSRYGYYYKYGYGTTPGESQGAHRLQPVKPSEEPAASS